MRTCPNCSETLVYKKYNKKKRLKCTNCGYETSIWEIEQEVKAHMDAVRKKYLNQFQDEETDEDLFIEIFNSKEE